VRAPEVVAAAVGCVVGLLSSSLSAGFAVFIGGSLVLEIGLDLRDWVVRRASSGCERWSAHACAMPESMADVLAVETDYCPSL
jgi:hypothetical protein